MRYGTMRYDTVYLTCSEKLTVASLVYTARNQTENLNEKKLKINRRA